MLYRVFVEYTIELETFEDENINEFHSFSGIDKVKSFYREIQGCVAGRDNLLDVAQCTNTMGETNHSF